MNDWPEVAVGYGEFTDIKTGHKSVMIEVTNRGKAPIGETKVEWAYEYETPQEATEDFVAEHGAEFARATGQFPGSVAETGRRYEFNPAEWEPDRPLGVG